MYLPALRLQICFVRENSALFLHIIVIIAMSTYFDCKNRLVLEAMMHNIGANVSDVYLH